LAFGEAAGEGLATGLGVLIGATSVVTAGELDAAGDGLAVPGSFELDAGSQATAKTIENVATTSSTMRLTKLVFRLMPVFFICVPSSQQD
jgi:hypothetical protein